MALVALGLAGLAIGAVVAAAPSGRMAPPPITSTLGVRDVTLSRTTPTVTLRLTLTNPGQDPVQLSQLVLSDVHQTTTVPLAVHAVAKSVQSVDFSLHPACSGTTSDAASARPGAITGYLREAGGSRLPILIDEELDQPGGLCGLLDQYLPRGWRTPIEASGARLDGGDLILDVPGLSGRDAAGSEPTAAGQVFTSVYAGDRLASATITHQTQLRLIAPAPCASSGSGDSGDSGDSIDNTGDSGDEFAAGRDESLPMSVRLFVRDGNGLALVLVQAGPALASWLIAQCS